MIKKNTKHFSVKMMCKMLSVSPSGYYDWRDRPLSSRAQENAELADKIKRIFDEEKSRAGAKRIAKQLKLEGTSVNRHRVARIMRVHGWRAKAARKFKATTNRSMQITFLGAHEAIYTISDELHSLYPMIIFTVPMFCVRFYIR